jgi:translation initiation factor IF-2
MKEKKLIERPPIVVVMGHIDHGKSKLLDYIRKSNVVEKEAGGITQHIGAYEVEIKNKKITFLDTPGHEAFTKMRERGARVADIAILVIAADEGIKAQTLEAHETIKAAGIPFIIALNKIDKPNSDPEKIKAQLAEKGILVEGYGGKIPVHNISAKTGEGINELLDIILLLAEIEGFRANPEENASGFVIESHLDSKRGISATLLIQNGTMKKGMFVVAGKTMAPIRIFEDFQGEAIEEATFSSPIKITGFDQLPEVGVEFKTFNTKEEAGNAKIIPETTRPVPETNEGIPLVIKTDVAGSLEALEKEILKIKTEKIKLNILKEAVGDINEDDIKLASSGKDSIVIGFNVKIDNRAKELAERFGVILFLENIIYKISEWLEKEIERRESAGKVEEEVTGRAKILKAFSQTRTKKVVGGQVVFGKIAEGKKIKIKRGDEEIGSGKILELQHNKMPVKEVKEGDEFGVMIETRDEIIPDDEIVVI